MAVSDRAGGSEPVELRHAHVHEDHIRGEGCNLNQRILSVDRSPDDVDPGHMTQQPCQALAHILNVIHYQGLDPLELGALQLALQRAQRGHAATSSSGSHARTVVPVPAREPIS
jgi:hypothetical protein